MSTKISQRTAATTLTGAETIGVIQGGLDRKCTVADLFAAGDALGSIRDFGCVGDNVTDDTTNLQAFFSDSSGKIKVLEDGAYKYTTALTVYSGGVHVVGVGTGGNFLSVLRPSNCAAFDINNVHHTIIENVMIWPQGGTPPADLWTVQNSAYSCYFRNMRIHYDINNVPSNAVLRFITPGVNNIVFENLRMRTDGAVGFVRGVQCDASCGSVTFRSLDINVADRGLKILGGNISIHDIYTESCGVHTVEIDHSGDASASLVMHGGMINQPTASNAFAIQSGSKNVMVKGVYIAPTGTATQVYVYGLTGSTNINFSPSNFTNSRISGGVAYDPTIIKFDVPNRPLPASKYTSINVTVGTLAAGVVTGAQRVRVLSTNATPGTQTTRTAVEMVAELVNCLPGDEYYLEIANTGAGTFTLGAGVGVTVSGTATIAQNTMRSFKVTVDSLTAMTFTNIGSVTYAA